MNRTGNKNPDNEYPTDSDPEVSAGYRVIANESAPARLDEIVLRQAAREARPASYFVNYLFSIRRQITFVATLVLALSVALQFNDALLSTYPDSINGISEAGDPGTGADELSAVVDASAEHRQEQARQGESIMSQGLLNKPMPNAVGGTEAMRPEIIRYCDDVQTATAALWWACIMDLDGAGHKDAAASERELLINTYPDFMPPK